MIDFVVVSSDLRPYVLDTWVKRVADDLHLVGKGKTRQAWQNQTYCESLLGTSRGTL